MYLRDILSFEFAILECTDWEDYGMIRKLSSPQTTKLVGLSSSFRCANEGNF
jgi:hypothetical protein